MAIQKGNKTMFCSLCNGVIDILFRLRIIYGICTGTYRRTVNYLT